MADDNHLVEDSFVALVLILSKLLHAEDRAWKTHWRSRTKRAAVMAALTAVRAASATPSDTDPTADSTSRVSNVSASGKTPSARPAR